MFEHCAKISAPECQLWCYGGYCAWLLHLNVGGLILSATVAF